MITMMFCLAYLISDIIYALLNPRIRFGDAQMSDTPRSPLYFAWRRFADNKAALVAGAILLLIILMAIFAPLISQNRLCGSEIPDPSLCLPASRVLVRRR